MKEVNMGTTLYDMNKQLIKQQKPMSTFAINEAKTNIVLPWLYDLFNDCYYYMLLCHDRRDYTIFNTHDASAEPKNMVDILIECFENRDLNIYSIDKNASAIEIWAGTKEEVFCYYLFPYDEGVIEV